MSPKTTLKDRIHNNLGLFISFGVLLPYTALMVAIVVGYSRVANVTLISGEHLSALEKAAATASVAPPPVGLESQLSGLPLNSRALLILITGPQNQEAWTEEDAKRGPRDAAAPLKERGYARDLTQEELALIPSAPGRRLAYGLKLVGPGIALHDQMVKVLSDMLGTAEAAAWIKERRHEPTR